MFSLPSIIILFLVILFGTLTFLPLLDTPVEQDEL